MPMLAEPSPRRVRLHRTARRERASGRVPAAAVERLRGHCACGGGCPRCASPEFAIGQAGGPQERQADALASQFTARQPTPSKPTVGHAAQAASAPLSATAASVVRQGLESSAKPLDTESRLHFGAVLGRALDPVRVHDNPRASAAAQAIGARAFVSGKDLVFAAGQYRPRDPHGRWLLAHELVHVAQQHVSGVQPGPRLIQRAGFAEVRAAESALDPASTQGVQVDPASLAVWFEFDSTALRRDAEVDSVTGFAQVQAAVLGHGAEAGDAQRVVVHGYASQEGDAQHNLDLSRRRAETVRTLLLQARVPAERIQTVAHGADGRFADLGANRRVEIELQPTVTRLEMTGEVVTGSPCTCLPNAQPEIAQWAIDYVEEIAPIIESVAARRGIPPLALAGAIAEEYDTRTGFHAVVDAFQDNVLPSFPEVVIDIDRWHDIHSRLLNTLEHDISNANIHVRTALEQVEAGRVQVPGSPPTDAQVSLIIDYLMDERGMVDMSGAVLEQGQNLFGPYIGSYDSGFQDAVLLDFYNIGYERYYVGGVEADGRVFGFLPRLQANPLHRPCPDPAGDGCQVLQARDRIEAAYEAGLRP